jgi:hypothetical protein
MSWLWGATAQDTAPPDGEYEDVDRRDSTGGNDSDGDDVRALSGDISFQFRAAAANNVTPSKPRAGHEDPFFSPVSSVGGLLIDLFVGLDQLFASIFFAGDGFA